VSVSVQEDFRTTGPTCLFPNIRHQRHKPRSLDGVLHRTLKGRTVAAALPAEDLALVRAQLFHRLHVFVIDKRRARAALTRAKPAAILSTSSKLLTDHLGIPRAQWRKKGIAVQLNR
jgi:hypothetical protein